MGKERQKNRVTRERLIDRTPLWLTFTIFMALILSVATVSLSISNYRWSTSNEIARQNKASEQLISLKLQNLDSYFSELSDFCVLPVYDNTFYNALLSHTELPEDTVAYLQQSVSLNYYSRTDLTAYRMDLLNHDIRIERNPGDQHMKVLYNVTGVTDSEEYQKCMASDSNYAILPSDHKGSLLRFCHTIIRITDRKPVALVTVEVTPQVMYSGFSGQTVALYNKDGELLYTNASDELAESIRALSSGSSEGIAGSAPEEDSDHSSDPDSLYHHGRAGNQIRLSGKEYLYTAGSDDAAGLTLAVYTPLSSITGELARIRSFSFLQGGLFLIIALACTVILIRCLTSPLSTLAASQKEVGSGQFPRIDIGGCRETKELSQSFNDMSEHIDQLVNDNLIASLNAKNARIEALEAQVNPHFLYNTLQAIGSEALMNDQLEIYDMLTKLASNMRYSINGSNEVTLEAELKFTDNYIALQKLRMGERLEVTRRIDRELLQAIVPKCSLELIVENSIKYGLTGDISRLHIEIDAFRQGSALVIRVRDDGAGMSPERLQEVRNRLSGYRPGDTGAMPERPSSDEASLAAGRGSSTGSAGSTGSSSSSGIGLVNLYSRLRIMYDNQANISIESSNREDHFTCVTLVLDSPGPDGDKPLTV